MKLNGFQDSDLLVGETKIVIMSESDTLEKISAYIAENKLKASLEAEVKYIVVEANDTEVHLEGIIVDFELEPLDKQRVDVTSQRLDVIYHD